VEVDHVSIYGGPALHPAAGRGSQALSSPRRDRWYVDETYLKVAGVWRYLYRAIDQFGQVVDVWLSPRRDAVAARRFFANAIKATGAAPVEVVTVGPVSTGRA